MYIHTFCTCCLHYYLFFNYAPSHCTTAASSHQLHKMPRWIFVFISYLWKSLYLSICTEMSVSVCVYAEMSAFLILFILQFTPLLPCLPDIVTLLGTTCNVTTLFTVIFRSKYCTVRRFLLLLLNLMPAMLHSLVVLVRVVLFLCRHFNTLLWLLMPL